MNPDEIKELFVKEIRNFLKPAAPVQAPPAVVQAPKPAQPLFNASANNRKPAPPKPKQEDEDFDMEKLMMEELMKRSQESPKEKPVNLTVSAPIVVSHMKV
jgi:Tfp pilus assembly protein PilP